MGTHCAEYKADFFSTPVQISSSTDCKVHEHEVFKGSSCASDRDGRFFYFFFTAKAGGGEGICRKQRANNRSTSAICCDLFLRAILHPLTGKARAAARDVDLIAGCTRAPHVSCEPSSPVFAG